MCKGTVVLYCMDAINISTSFRAALREDSSTSTTGAVRIDVAVENDQNGSIAVGRRRRELRHDHHARFRERIMRSG